MPSKIIEIFRVKAKKGEVGIEIEMEGVNLASNVKGWLNEADGSLRGEAMEYILSAPVPRDKVKTALKALQDNLRDNGAKLEPSDRCGVHIHINCQDMTIQQAINFAVMWLIFEDVLVKYCGEDREGNLFCERAKDAEFLIQMLINAQVYQSLNYFDQHLRYSAINMTAIPKFGSIEFRTLRSPKNFATIADWADILLALKDNSLKFNMPRDIVEACSFNGAASFFSQVFGGMSETLACKGLSQMIMEGVRRVQNIAYAELVVKKKEQPKHQIDEWDGLPRVQAAPDRIARNHAPAEAFNWANMAFNEAVAPAPAVQGRVRNARFAPPRIPIADYQQRELDRLAQVVQDIDAQWNEAEANDDPPEEIRHIAHAYNQAATELNEYKAVLRGLGVEVE